MRSALFPIALLGCYALLASPAPARAQTGLAGDWLTGATSTKVAVESWGAHCGPRPPSSNSAGGQTVKITEAGRQLVVHSGRRKIHTNKCWSPNPALRRESSSYLDGQWRTVCRTPRNDPREETGTYTIKALTENKVLYRDVSRYNWKLNESACVATITTTQTLTRRGVGTAKPSEQSPPPAAPSCVAGKATKLSLAPHRAVVQLGEQRCFRARLVDARGCALSGGVRLALKHGPGLKGRLQGACFHAHDSAAEGEGTFTVTATGGGFTARAEVEVRSMDLSGLIAQRIDGVSTDHEEEAQSEVLPVPPPSRKAKVAARAVQDTGSDLVPLLGAALAVLLVGLGFLVMRRRTRPSSTTMAPATDADWGPSAAAEAAGAQAAPTPSNTAPSTAAPAAAEQWICPTCRRGYPAGGGTCTHCPEGQNTLMPYSEFSARGKQEAQPRRCADCGARWDTPVNFCGDCGGRNLLDA